MAGEPENQRITRLTPLDDVLASIDGVGHAGRAARGRTVRRAFTASLAEDVAAAAGQPAELAGPARRLRRSRGRDRRRRHLIRRCRSPSRRFASMSAKRCRRAPTPSSRSTPSSTAALASRLLRRRRSATECFPATPIFVAGDCIARAGWRLNDFNIAMLAMAGRKQVLVREPRVRLVKARADADTVLDAIGDLLARALNARGCAVRRSAGDLAAALADDDGRRRRSPSAAPAAAATTPAWTRSPGTAASWCTASRFHRARPRRSGRAAPRRCCCCRAGSMPRWRDGSRSACRWSTACRPAAMPPTRPRVVPLARKVASPIGLAELVPVRLTAGRAEPIASGYWPLGSLAGTDGWILVPADSEGFPAGSEVVIRPLP